MFQNSEFWYAADLIYYILSSAAFEHSNTLVIVQWNISMFTLDGIFKKSVFACSVLRIVIFVTNMVRLCCWQGRGLLSPGGHIFYSVLLLWSEPESLPACPIFTPVCISGPAVSPVGWLVRSVLYKPDKFHGGASFRSNFSELSLSWNSDSKFTDVPPSFCFCGAWYFPVLLPSPSGCSGWRCREGPRQGERVWMLACTMAFQGRQWAVQGPRRCRSCQDCVREFAVIVSHPTAASFPSW